MKLIVRSIITDGQDWTDTTVAFFLDHIYNKDLKPYDITRGRWPRYRLGGPQIDQSKEGSTWANVKSEVPQIPRMVLIRRRELVVLGETRKTFGTVHH